MYADIKKQWVPETKAFVIWFFLKYPDLLKKDSNLSEAYQSFQESNSLSDHENKMLFSEMIEKLRSGMIVMDHITTKYGL
jgi:hypothetical protein